MTYERINFVDQSVERPRTYEMTHNADGSITLTDSFGLVNELGTPINADTMNHIEDGIDSKQDQLIAGDNIILENNVISAKSGAMPIGTIIPVNAGSTYVPEGCLPCDGATYSRSQFKDFCENYIGGKNPLLNVCTIAEYEAEVATFGQCSKFGADRVTQTGFDAMATSAIININYEQFRALYPDGIELKFIFDGSNWTLDGQVVNLSDYAMSATGTPKENNYFVVGYWFGRVSSFRVPLIKDGAVIQQALTDSELGKSYNAGLPNIEGTFKADRHTAYAPTGAFYLYDTSGATGADDTGTSNSRIHGLDASLSNSIYGNSDTVQMNAVSLRYFVVVTNGQVNQSLMDWNQWASSLQGRLDTDINNITNLGKSNITDLLSPDYSSGVEKVWGQTYTAEVSGWLYYAIRFATTASSSIDAYTCLWIDEIPVGGAGGQKGNASSTNSGLVKIAKGSTYRTASPDGTGYSAQCIRFYPDKGAN